MVPTRRPIPFVVVSTNHGTLIVNRFDQWTNAENKLIGVGVHLLSTSGCEEAEVNFAMALLTHRHANFGNGVVALDCGANIGVHTVEWARLMHDWGRVIAFEAQERIYYALAGNIAINNCLNATAHLAAVGAECGEIRVPVPNYLVPSTFGSLELKQRPGNEFIGQTIDYSEAGTVPVPLRSLDSFGFERVDFIKIDVEGMELDVLAGAARTIERCRPQMIIEVIKSDRAALDAFLKARGYATYRMGINILAVHASDPTAKDISVRNGELLLAS